MEDKKINILFVPSDGAGVGHFRSIWPAQQINKDFKNQFYVEVNQHPDVNDLNYLSKFNIIHFHRELGPFEKMPELFKKLKDMGIVLIMDIDDYWMPPTTHPLYYVVIKNKINEKIVETIKIADYVTATTDLFANEIRKYNRNVFVIPNAIASEHQMWNGEDAKQTDKVRISVICGSSHYKDLQLLESDMNRLHSDVELKGKYQIVMCGYDVRGSATQIMPDGREVTRKIFPHESIWNKFEEILTNNYAVCDKNYETYLKKCIKDPFKHVDVSDLNYLRRWTLPLTQYGKHYDYTDIVIAPLEENMFNYVKSELKLIESGFKKKVLVAQDYGIHSNLIKNGENGILIPTEDNNKGWYKALKKLILDKDYRNSLATNLNKFVMENYTLEIITKKRAKFYQDVYSKMNKKEDRIAEYIIP
jgi:glycosyltransferase involved in cell wall biosynthesis